MAEDKTLLDIEGRRLPYDIDAEQAILGSILIDPNCINEVATLIKTEYFYVPQHREIYKTLQSMSDLNQQIDPITLVDRLKKEGAYDKSGGKSYIKDLVQSVVTSANVITYAHIVRERYYARALIEASQSIIKDASENTGDAENLLNSAEQKIYEIREGRVVQGLEHIKSVIEQETYDRLIKMTKEDTRADYIGIPTGIGNLDRILTGLHKSDLIILGARPGMGKTSLALNIVRNVAVSAKKTVAVFSLEMSRDQLAQRLLSSEAAVKSEKLRTGELSQEEWTRLGQAGAHLSEAEIYLDESSDITVTQMKAKVRRMKHVDLVVVDYLGLIKPTSFMDNRVQQISEITRSLKLMAKELKIPVVVCAQLSRASEGKGKSHKPGLADLRDSGSIEQDADIVLFIYREDYYRNESKSEVPETDPNKTECIIAKNRHGETGSVELYWDPQYTRFTSPVKMNE